MPTSPSVYPLRLEGTLDPPLSRWLPLVKWLLVIPHVIVLAFLWIATGVLSVAAFFAILVTGSYPRSIFDFNVGVLRDARTPGDEWCYLPVGTPPGNPQWRSGTRHGTLTS